MESTIASRAGLGLVFFFQSWSAVLSTDFIRKCTLVAYLCPRRTFFDFEFMAAFSSGRLKNYRFGGAECSPPTLAMMTCLLSPHRMLNLSLTFTLYIIISGTVGQPSLSALDNESLGAPSGPPDTSQNTTYYNPILPGFYPDPSCIFLPSYGDTFFCVSSSFNAIPGIPIHASKDLRNWKLVGKPLSLFEINP